MATKLESLVVRESTEKANDREILVALTPDQRISMRLKGMKSGAVSIDIKRLFEQLTDSPIPIASAIGNPVKPKPVSIKRKDTNEPDPMISLSRLRSLNYVTPGSIEVLAKLDQLILELIGETKTQQS